MLTVAEWAVLGLVAEGRTHGFAVAKELSPDGGVGRVWSVRRPLVYRALEVLTDAGLIVEAGSEAGAGPARTLVRVTPRGRAALRRWLREPVEHIRDIRSQFLLKLALLDRAGRDPGELIDRQRAAVERLVAGMEEHLVGSDGFDRVLLRWRLESARAVVCFLAEVVKK